MSSAICLNLDQSRILPSANGFNSPPFAAVYLERLHLQSMSHIKCIMILVRLYIALMASYLTGRDVLSQPIRWQKPENLESDIIFRCLQNKNLDSLIYIGLHHLEQ